VSSKNKGAITLTEFGKNDLAITHHC